VHPAAARRSFLTGTGTAAAAAVAAGTAAAVPAGSGRASAFLAGVTGIASPALAGVASAVLAGAGRGTGPAGIGRCGEGIGETVTDGSTGTAAGAAAAGAAADMDVGIHRKNLAFQWFGSRAANGVDLLSKYAGKPVPVTLLNTYLIEKTLLFSQKCAIMKYPKNTCIQ